MRNRTTRMPKRNVKIANKLDDDFNRVTTNFRKEKDQLDVYEKEYFRKVEESKKINNIRREVG